MYSEEERKAILHKVLLAHDIFSKTDIIRIVDDITKDCTMIYGKLDNSEQFSITMTVLSVLLIDNRIAIVNRIPKGGE